MGITWEEGFLEERLSLLGLEGQRILLECLVGGAGRQTVQPKPQNGEGKGA